MTEALLGFAAIFLLSFLRVPLGVAMSLVGLIGLAILRGWHPALANVSLVVFETGFAYVLSVVPLFVLMGNFVARAGLAHELFLAANAFLGHRRGGLAMATVVACGGFGAICGSSLATAATMTRVAYPSMKEIGYKDSLAVGAIASGGTLGILVPPSAIMVIYGILTETSIGHLFIAGLVPAIVAVMLLCAAVAVVTWRDPKAGPPTERQGAKARLNALGGIWAVGALFVLVIGGIYGGVFTATEAAGVGAGGSFLIALLRRSLTWRSLAEILLESARTTAMIFIILIGAMIFTGFINFTTLPFELRDFVEQFSPTPLVVIAAMMVIYILLGMVMDELAIITLTIPVFFPIVVALGFDPIWFGVLIVTIAEIGMISPPVGLNLFVVNALVPNVGLVNIYRGVSPFVIADFVRLAILMVFPSLALWLPSIM
jgi:C4-dicarboxylate transporter DctM subunit